MNKKNILFLCILFLISLLVRAGVYNYYISKNNNYWQVDSQTYHLVAQQLASNKGLTLQDNRPNFYRLPGYPLFLAACYKIVGENKERALWVQVFLASLLPVLIFFLANIMFPTCLWVAYGASLYGAFHLGLVLFSGFFMTETLFLFFFLLFLICFFSIMCLWGCHSERVLSYNIMAKVFGAGIFLGLASLVRPVGQYVIVLTLFLILFSGDHFKNKLIKMIILFVGWLIPVSFWLVRNYMLLGYVFFHTLPGGHFLYLSAARVAMHTQNCSYQQARENLRQEVNNLMVQQEYALGRPLTEIERCYAHETIAKKHFKSAPLITLKNWATDMLRTSLSLYSSELVYLEAGRNSPDYFNKDRTIWSFFQRYLFPQTEKVWLKYLIYYEIISFLIILILFALGLLRSFYTEIYGTFITAILFMGLFIVLALSGGYARMRLPAEVLLIILAFSMLCVFKRGRA